MSTTSPVYGPPIGPERIEIFWPTETGRTISRIRPGEDGC